MLWYPVHRDDQVYLPMASGRPKCLWAETFFLTFCCPSFSVGVFFGVFLRTVCSLLFLHVPCVSFVSFLIACVFGGFVHVCLRSSLPSFQLRSILVTLSSLINGACNCPCISLFHVFATSLISYLIFRMLLFILFSSGLLIVSGFPRIGTAVTVFSIMFRV